MNALRAIKTAIYYNIAKELAEKYHLKYQLTYTGIYLLKKGYCFHLELGIQKEISLLKRDLGDDGVVSYVDSPISLAMEKRHNILPSVCSALKAMHQANPSFGPAVMIAKRWLYAHLIDDGAWPNECTELLMAYLYLQKWAFGNTACPQTAFIRFLLLLAETDWQNDVFCVWFNNSFDGNNILQYCVTILH